MPEVPTKPGSDHYEIEAARAELMAVLEDSGKRLSPAMRALLNSQKTILKQVWHNADTIHTMKQDIDELKKKTLSIMVREFIEAHPVAIKRIIRATWIGLASYLALWLLHLADAWPTLLHIIAAVEKLI